MKTISTLPCPDLTRVSTFQPWGLMQAKGTRLLCSDGIIRAPHSLASTADTFFSVPCSMRIKGQYCTGYMTTEEEHKAPYRRAYVFRVHSCYTHVLPDWPASYSPEHDALIAKAFAQEGTK